MGKKHSLKSVLDFYTRQIKKNQCEKKNLKGCRRSKGSQFDRLFKITNQRINVQEQAEQWLVIQWFEEHEDQRFKLYIGEYYEPKVKKSLKDFAFVELLNIVSPQNIINS